jgi:hypothetical protein
MGWEGFGEKREERLMKFSCCCCGDLNRVEGWR